MEFPPTKGPTMRVTARPRTAFVLLLCAAALTARAGAQSNSASDLAKVSQNPIGNMVSLPLQNNTSFGIGPQNAKSNVLNIQPVYPMSLSKKWNLINRAIVPVIYRQELIPGTGSAFGLGDISYSGFISPAQPGAIIWGVGPSFLFPTSTEDRWASNKWSAGVAVIALGMPGNFVVGGLVQNVWSFAGDSAAADVNTMLAQVIFNYNLADGWYITSTPTIVANWEAPADNRWTVPVGGGAGKVMQWGSQPVDLQAQAFYNVVAPNPLVGQGPNIDNEGSTWTLRIQLKFLFPKGP
jgi:hypothetical protein